MSGEDPRDRAELSVENKSADVGAVIFNHMVCTRLKLVCEDRARLRGGDLRGDYSRRGHNPDLGAFARVEMYLGIERSTT